LPNGGRIIIAEDVKTIALTSRLPAIEKSMVIEGNSVTITRAESMAVNANSQVMYINITGALVTISRVWFKDGWATDNGGAININIYAGTVALESCIFSGNRNSSTLFYGGAIYKAGPGTLNISGCTFYKNSNGTGGGAISASSLNLTGNLFYGNTATQYPVISGNSATSLGWNVADVAIGAGPVQSGFAAATGDKTVSVPVVSPVNLKLPSGSEAANVITTLPEGYPLTDFYGNNIEDGAAAGAVQGTVAGGYLLDLLVNFSARGSVSTDSTPDDNGCYSGIVTITADPTAPYILKHWLVNGRKTANDLNTLVLTLTGHTKVQAVFERIIHVTKFTDASGSVTEEGTLRHAMTNVEAETTIVLDKETAGKDVIELTSRLPTISRSITIEGNGVILTRSESWTTVDDNSQMMYISSTVAVVTVSRVWFKDGRVVNNGGAIGINYGTVNLESCIFSGNQAGSSGGTIHYRHSYVNLNVKGCTFYNNIGPSVIFGTDAGGDFIRSTLNLTGNLFYGNTTGSGGRASVSNGYTAIKTSYGYNVTDATSFGYNAVNGDKSIGDGMSNLPISPISFRPLSNGPAANVIDTLPEEYPAEDFYGEPITNNGGAAAAGAVQGSTASGYYLGLSVNNGNRGSISANPAPDTDGIVRVSDVTITATVGAGYQLGYWLIDGIKSGNTTPLQLTLTTHTTVQAVFIKVFVVNDFSDATDSATVAGTLRHAITDASVGDTIRIGTSGQTIQLSSRLPDITKSMTIEGNGVILTPSASWPTPGNSTQMLCIDSPAAEVTVSRVWFKDGRATSLGAAICINAGNLNLESCIFSGNQTNNSTASGGTIFKQGTGTLNVRGCTFYNNSTAYRGGAIYNNTGTTTLTGNLFYGNTASASGGPVVFNNAGTVTSNGWNVVDVALGAGGFASASGDKSIGIGLSALPVSPASFRLFHGSETANVIVSLPVNYPDKDFYGDPLPTTGAAAGAVQGTVSGSGYYLGVSVNNAAAGELTTDPEPDDDGLCTGTVTIKAEKLLEGYMVSWIVNGTKTAGKSPFELELELKDHTFVRAVFEKVKLVTIFTDESNAASTEGTLRHALANAEDGDVIILSGATAGQTVIALNSRLPDITKSITIEGGGVTITKASTWTEYNANVQLMCIDGGESTISRVWFKDGRASSNGGAIRINTGTVNLESCIFSGNRVSGTYTGGGAIFNAGAGTLNMKGCTFYNNSSNPDDSNSYGGAIRNNGGTLSLTGNLFYGNTSAPNRYPVIFNNGGTVTSNGFNVADTASPGYTRIASDKTISEWPISPVTLKPLSGGGAAGVVVTRPENYPAKDFYDIDIEDGAAAGAIQGTVSGSGYILNLSANYSDRGSVSVTDPAPNADSFYSGTVTIAATAVLGCNFDHWLVDGTDYGSVNPLTLPLTGHRGVQAVFEREFWAVTDFSDEIGSVGVAGRLRYAVTNAQNGDTIRVVGATAGQTSIELTSRLPTIWGSITIEGGGVILTRAASWTTVDNDSQMMSILSSSADVTISRVWFKDGRAATFGGAIRCDWARTLTLESCIFSGNRSNTYDTSGGAIYHSSGTLNVKGCTFYNNSAGYGGAIYRGGTVNLTGNLFYGNTASNAGPVVYQAGGISLGYNVVNVALGTASNQSGFAANTPNPDRTLETILGNNTTSPFVDITDPANPNLAPVSGLYSETYGIPGAWGIANMPATDFYGEERTWPGSAGAVK
jgi:hypothetical protein